MQNHSQPATEPARSVPLSAADHISIGAFMQTAGRFGFAGDLGGLDGIAEAFFLALPGGQGEARFVLYRADPSAVVLADMQGGEMALDDVETALEAVCQQLRTEALEVVG